MRVAFLADLGELELDAARGGESRAERQVLEVEALHDEVLTEGAVGHVGPAVLEILDGFESQQAHLTVPLAGMRVALDAPVFLELHAGLRGLLNPLAVAGANGVNGAHILFSPVFSLPQFPAGSRLRAS